MRGELLAERFRIGERLGSGAVGEVWAAQDERMRRDVAVKLVSALFEAREAETRARFRREVQLAGRLSHPNIVTVHDWGEMPVGGRPVFYLVMELVRGVPLDRKLKEDTPAWPLAAGWAVQIAQALDAAHRQGVLHRDIKPANVLLTPEGAAKVLDFGLAKFLGETVSAHALTMTGAALGSPPYMSPEQAQGAREVDHRADLYSLGCLLYHAVTGRPPFVSDNPLAVLRMHMDDTPAPPGALVGGLPRALSDLVLSLLAKRPEDRPADAAAVHDALSTVLVEESADFGGGSILETAQLGSADSVTGRILGKAWELRQRTEALRAAAEKQAGEVLRNARADVAGLLDEASARLAEAERIRAEAQADAEKLREQAGPRITSSPYGFGFRRRGYDRAQVDEHISRLLSEREAMQTGIGRLKRKVAKVAAETPTAAGGVPQAARPSEAENLIADALTRADNECEAKRARRPQTEDTTSYGFNVVKRGYDRSQVREFIGELMAERELRQARITALQKLFSDLSAPHEG